MNLVVDSSVAAKWFFAERNSREAQLLLSPRFSLIAPDFILSEVANVIWKKYRRNEISHFHPYIEALDRLTEVIKLHPLADYVIQAVSLAIQIDHPVYDCIYLTCAQGHSLPFLTADESLRRKVLAECPSIAVWSIGDLNV
ncbi:MAG: type II toxin-antitoxin system VapC family toxin [Gammaproteobacteria bacterium]|nr:type II toxin-antitoxin system VapC family toxin [Gammaproteobacteria bacterium]